MLRSQSVNATHVECRYFLSFSVDLECLVTIHRLVFPVDGIPGSGGLAAPPDHPSGAGIGAVEASLGERRDLRFTAHVYCHGQPLHQVPVSTSSCPEVVMAPMVGQTGYNTANKSSSGGSSSSSSSGGGGGGGKGGVGGGDGEVGGEGEGEGEEGEEGEEGGNGRGEGGAMRWGDEDEVMAGARCLAWDELLCLPAKVSDLSRNARLVLTAWTPDGVPYGGTALLLFDERGVSE